MNKRVKLRIKLNSFKKALNYSCAISELKRKSKKAIISLHSNNYRLINIRINIADFR